jgi:hypothetical protein
MEKSTENKCTICGCDYYIDICDVPFIDCKCKNHHPVSIDINTFTNIEDPYQIIVCNGCNVVSTLKNSKTNCYLCNGEFVQPEYLYQNK